ncbi:MAG: DUF790 family protein [Candidatus Competibacterales bacterium]|nr:DUF790 family protein [Candidatus Competibacterales bacterium]
MLPGPLLLNRRRRAQVHPYRLKPAQHPWAGAVLATLDEHLGRPRGELMAALRALEGDSPDYRVVRGLAHLALNEAEFGLALSEPHPETLRHEAFVRAAELGHAGDPGAQVLEELAERYATPAETLRAALFADLPENHLLTRLPEYSPQTLIDRYDLAQAQGLLYSATALELTAHRNVPGEYRRLFQRLKFHGLMYAVEGCLEDGYRISVDGPASLFRQTRRYGINMAAFLPALLQLSRWALRAELRRQGRDVVYELDSGSDLRSHHARPPAYDSLLEQRFAERWEQFAPDWALEREVAIIDLGGTVFVPDFALRHPDGRTALVEIVGFWHPDYLRRKLDKVRRAGRRDLILAVSDRLNVGDGDLATVPGPVIRFKGRLEPRQVLAVLEGGSGP